MSRSAYVAGPKLVITYVENIRDGLIEVDLMAQKHTKPMQMHILRN